MSSRFTRALPVCALGAALALPQALSAAGRADTADYVMSDFEAGMLDTPLWGYWYVFTDRNTATAVDTVYGNSFLTTFDSTGFPLFDTLGFPDAKTFPPGYNESSTRALRFGYSLGDRKLSCGAACLYEPYVGFGVGFTTRFDTLDLTGATGIAFWAKADSAPLVMNVSVATKDSVATAADYAKRISVDTAWKRFVIPLAAGPDFLQPTWSPKKPFRPSQVKGMGFGISRGENTGHPANAVTIDDLTILGWKFVEPDIVIDPSSTRRSAMPGALRLTVTREGGRAHIRLPARYAGMRGEVEAVDASGRVRARQSFGATMSEVTLEFGSGAVPAGIQYRVRAQGR